MFDDDRADEPPPDGRQFDAVTRFEEPEEPGPGDLGPPVPEAPSPDSIHPRVQALFWALVLVFNVALLAVGLGLLFVVFEGNLDLGGTLLAAGLVLFVYGAYRYRGAKDEIAAITEGKG